MLALKLIYTNDLDFAYEIQDLRNILRKKGIKIGIVESVELNNHIIKILCEDESYSNRVKDIITLYISNVIYKVVIKKYKDRELLDFLTENYFFLKQNELIEVEEKIMKILLGEELVKSENLIYCMNKMNSITEKIKSCIEENLEINISGFLTFRMKELREDIEGIIDKVVEGYMVEKEYLEFIKLLKYFVDIQESKIDEVNILIDEAGDYSIKDKEQNDMFNEFIKDLVDSKIGVDAKVEDVIISGLITNAPSKVIIHGRENCANKEFMNTIDSVFENRVINCTGCSLCIQKQVKF